MSTYDAKQMAKSTLEQAVRDFISASKANGDLDDETIVDICDTVYDASGNTIDLQEP